jgi:molybdate transport system substrate-binding protein
VTGGARASLLALALVVAACAPGPNDAQGHAAEGTVGEVTVFAASSLTEAFRDLAEVLESRGRGATVTFNFASSSDLGVQIQEGAPADVFASADGQQMKLVTDAGLAGEPVIFATNRLVILVPEDNPAGIHGPHDLADPGIKLVLADPEVPAGNYARQALTNLGVGHEAESNVVSNERDVKAVVTKVALGEADAGIAYATDVTADVAGSVEALALPAEADVAARYPIALLSDAPNPPGAKAFVELVTSPAGRRVLSEHGFGLP